VVAALCRFDEEYKVLQLFFMKKEQVNRTFQGVTKNRRRVLVKNIKKAKLFFLALVGVPEALLFFLPWCSRNLQTDGCDHV
jgi:hypothetical protein